MSTEPPIARPEIAQALELDQPASGGRARFAWITVAALALVAAGIGAVLLSTGDEPTRYQTARVEQGPLTVVVTATGTLQPTNQVDVGSELSGTVRTVQADFNDAVRVGQVLARLDTTRLEAQVLQSEAALKAARARVLENQANEEEMRRRLARARDLYARRFVSEEALAAAQAAQDRALATLASARSQVDQMQAALEMDRTNLGKAVIRSPINGIVLARRVEPGQTVAASFQAPVLFTLAEDLTRMELHVDVDEADVGRVELAQSATFAVDAYPGQEFPSKVTEVRNAAKTVSGVVTYETVLAADNAKLLLRPGMTATASIVVSRLSDVVLVPNAALRFSPPAVEAPASRSFTSRLLPSPPRPPPREVTTTGDRHRQQVWTLRDGRAIAVPVVVGATDGRMTQVVGGELPAGTEVLIDTLRARR